MSKFTIIFCSFLIIIGCSYSQVKFGKVKQGNDIFVDQDIIEGESHYNNSNIQFSSERTSIIFDVISDQAISTDSYQVDFQEKIENADELIKGEDEVYDSYKISPGEYFKCHSDADCVEKWYCSPGNLLGIATGKCINGDCEVEFWQCENSCEDGTCDFCQTNEDCNDGNVCTEDVCLDGYCKNNQLPHCYPCELHSDCENISSYCLDENYQIFYTGRCDKSAGKCESLRDTWECPQGCDKYGCLPKATFEYYECDLDSECRDENPCTADYCSAEKDCFYELIPECCSSDQDCEEGNCIDDICVK